MKPAWTLLAVTLTAAPAVAQDDPPKKPDQPSVRFVCTEQPSIRAGVFRLDLHMRIQSDFRAADQDLENHGGTYETEQKRIGVTGRFTNRIQFEIERELRHDNPWRDVFVNVEIARALEVRGGKFKVPFSYDQLTGPSRLDFAYRSLLAETIAPGRDVGVMLHGQLFRRIVTYQAGIFRHDGENARLREPIFLLPGEARPKSQRSVAARVVVEPLRHSEGRRELRRLYLGVAVTSSDVPEGLNSLRGRSLFGTNFAEQVYVLGARHRLGTEAVWMPGPFSVKAEYARATEQRRQQGLLDDDISDFVTSGWYVSGTWAVTGESKNSNIEPRTPLFQGGFGAVELAARYEQMSFASALKEGTAFLNPRADPLPESVETVWTFGVNWYLNKWGKIVVNGIRERFEIPEGTSVPVQPTNWAAVARLQFVM
jgi:phosphate-selective porin OprO/OprP